MAQAAGTQMLVFNVQAQQRQFTATWDVTYDLESVGDIAVTVSLSLSTDSGATYPNLCATVTGDVGAGVLPGVGKHIVWNAGADFPGLSSPTCRLRVTANDGYVEAPAGFVAIAAGTFMMGSPTTEPLRNLDETQHQVTLTHGLYVQTTEVTNQQFRDMAQWAYDSGYVWANGGGLFDKLDGQTTLALKFFGPGYDMTFEAGVISCTNPNDPVRHVRWFGAAAYCDWLSLQQGLPRAYNHSGSNWQCNGGSPYTAAGYRLPTEAEWEYACRAGTQTPFSTGSCLDAVTEANYFGTGPYTGCTTGPYLGLPVPVGSYLANAFGLYDMHGNLFEWCNDWYGTYDGTVTDPVGVTVEGERVFRGGSWNRAANYCRSAYRFRGNPWVQSDQLGFRLVRSAN